MESKPLYQMFVVIQGSEYTMSIESETPDVCVLHFYLNCILNIHYNIDPGVKIPSILLKSNIDTIDFIEIITSKDYNGIIKTIKSEEIKQGTKSIKKSMIENVDFVDRVDILYYNLKATLETFKDSVVEKDSNILSTIINSAIDRLRMY